MCAVAYQMVLRPLPRIKAGPLYTATKLFFGRRVAAFFECAMRLSLPAGAVSPPGGPGFCIFGIGKPLKLLFLGNIQEKEILGKLQCAE